MRDEDRVGNGREGAIIAGVLAKRVATVFGENGTLGDVWRKCECDEGVILRAMAGVHGFIRRHRF